MNKLLLFIVIVLASIFSCKTDKMLTGKNERGSYYVMFKYKAVNKDSVTVFGRVRTEHSDSPPAALTIDGNIYHINQSGNYRMGLDHGKHGLTALSMGYNELKMPSLSL